MNIYGWCVRCLLLFLSFICLFTHSFIHSFIHSKLTLRGLSEHIIYTSTCTFIRQSYNINILQFQMEKTGILKNKIKWYIESRRNWLFSKMNHSQLCYDTECGLVKIKTINLLSADCLFEEKEKKHFGWSWTNTIMYTNTKLYFKSFHIKISIMLSLQLVWGLTSQTGWKLTFAWKLSWP